MSEYIDFFHEHLVLSVVWVGLAGALIFSYYKSATRSFKTVSPSELTNLTNRENGLVLDIRSREEFKRGHIAGAINIKAADLKEGNFAGIESHKSDPIVLVCKTGQTAQQTADVLTKAGFEQVSVLKSGLISWNEANLPLVRGKK
ncbi:rhodanese-like domain-containing protein [Vibrio zhugei]|uniref:Rhodanese-like domain-containing protein n=1 Tax=Vibrio zhugei TaxID=2479546 RepID=A0ABV7C6M6_9VIBR|nr:rhodanese-like domain-containing protein [Vibrio zhugei]